jgi:hypothetical protein
MSDLMLLIHVQARVATFLAGLSLDRLVALAEGRLKLAVVDESPAKPEPDPAARSRFRRLGRELPACSTQRARRSGSGIARPLDEGTDLLAMLNRKVPDLKVLAKALNIPSTGTKAELPKKILTLTLGGRGKHAPLRHG